MFFKIVFMYTIYIALVHISIVIALVQYSVLALNVRTTPPHTRLHAHRLKPGLALRYSVKDYSYVRAMLVYIYIVHNAVHIH